MKVGSLFSGIGGIDLGFISAGYKIAWANDMDSFACKTYRHNFPDTLLYEQDIRTLVANLLDDIDILVAGFPCQPFSVMGYKRGFKDSRGNLFFEIARIAEAKRPPIIFLENVQNLMNHDCGKTFLIIYNTLVELGYMVKYKVVNATDFDIPQNRARIFIVAFLDYETCNSFKFPDAKESTKTIGDILDRTKQHSDIYYYTEKYKHFAELTHKVKGKSGIYRIDDSGITNKKYTVCPTLKANMGTYPHRVPIIRDDFGVRQLTPRECLDFQGFPKWFNFKGIPLNEAYKQAGNTVCVPVIEGIAERICTGRVSDKI